MRKANFTGLLATCLITMILLAAQGMAATGTLQCLSGSPAAKQESVEAPRILLAAENKSECENRKRACFSACQDKPSTCEGPRCLSPQAQCISPCQWIKC